MSKTLNRRLRLFDLALTLGLTLACAVGQADGRSIPFDRAAVSSRDERVFVISWHALRVGHVRVFAGLDPANVGRARPVAEGSGSGEVTVSTLPSAPRWYFELVPDHGDPLVVADRSLHLTTAANFRDAGGYRSADGRWVRTGLAYRTNGIEHLTDDELAEIEQLHINLVCDLRTAEEIHRGPDRVPAGVAELSADVLADDADLVHAAMARAAGQTGSGDRPEVSLPPPHELEQRIYRDFVRLESARRAYRILFERLADRAALPVIFHCTAGKDRTGWAEAVFLTILGVPRSTIVEDYELTNQYLSGARMVADPAALDAAFDQVKVDYGSFDDYLTRGLQLSATTIAAIRSNFLTD
jgi:protein-tyrosine phosphatase